MPFGDNPQTGDARISGSLASLVGLETALENNDDKAIDDAIKTIVLLHSMILSFGGIPLLYYGDAVGMLNSLEYLAEPSKRNDNRWMHRSHFDWNKAEKRHQTGTVEQKIFNALKKLIELRKETIAFADFDNRQLLTLENPNLLAFSRTDPQNSRNKVLVIANFNVETQAIPINILQEEGYFITNKMKNLCTGTYLPVKNDTLAIPPLSFYWFTE